MFYYPNSSEKFKFKFNFKNFRFFQKLHFGNWELLPTNTCFLKIIQNLNLPIFQNRYEIVLGFLRFFRDGEKNLHILAENYNQYENGNL